MNNSFSLRFLIIFVLQFSVLLILDICSCFWNFNHFCTLNTSIYVTFSVTAYSVRMGVSFLFLFFLVLLSISDHIKLLINAGLVFLILAVTELLKLELTYESTLFSTSTSLHHLLLHLLFFF